MGEENNKSQNENKPRRFNQQQYDLLRKCSDKEDITEWNKYRIEYPYIDIELENADFLEEHFKKAVLWGAHLRGAKLRMAHLDGAKLWFVHFEGAELIDVCLKGASLAGSHLEGTHFWQAHLEGANFRGSFVDNQTEIFLCKIDKKTDFRNVDIDNIRMESGTKQLLEYNIRRLNWGDWYKEHKILKWPVWLFWLMNDYGSSSVRIIGCFLGVAVVFAAIYYFMPGLTENLHIEGGRFLNIVRACYFSVITMVTGFENINPNDKSIAGHILIAVQVILGYVLLGALVARLAVLFTGEGPAGKFADKEKN